MENRYDSFDDYRCREHCVSKKAGSCDTVNILLVDIVCKKYEFLFSIMSSLNSNLDIIVEIDKSVISSADVHAFVGSIDQGTSSTRFLVFTPKGEIAAWSQMEHLQIFPPGEDKVRNLSIERVPTGS